ncbi:MAG: DNA helicase RecG, partial [Nitrospina sp.]|nr:DNA helicase RecG [Nitrospina sp.]
MNSTGWKKPSLDDPIQFIKGVGPKKALLLQKLQLAAIEDFLYFLPFRYEDRSQLKTISTLIPGEFSTFMAEVLNAGVIYMGRRKRVFEVIFQDETGTTRSRWFRFNETYMLEKFKTGAKLIVSGKPTVNKRSGVEIVHPDTERVTDETTISLEAGKIVPVYHTTDGLHQKSMRSILSNVLDKYLPLVDEVIPEDILRRHKLLARSEAFQNAHFPPSTDFIAKDLDNFKTPAQKRLIFEELFLIQTGLAFKKKHAGEIKTGMAFKTRGHLIKQFIKLLPFQLTAAQK